MRFRRRIPQMYGLGLAAAGLFLAAGCGGGDASQRASARPSTPDRPGAASRGVYAGVRRPSSGGRVPSGGASRGSAVRRRSGASGASGVSAAEAVRLRRAEPRVTVDFDEEPLGTVLDYIRERGGLNLVIDPEVDRTQPVTISVTEMRFTTFLEWVLRLTETHVSVRDEAVYITAEAAGGDHRLGIYPVAGLTRTPPDYSHDISEDAASAEEDDNVFGDIFD